MDASDEISRDPGFYDEVMSSDLHNSLSRRHFSRTALFGAASAFSGSDFIGTSEHEAASRQLMVDLGGHGEGVIARDNPGSLKSTE